MPAASGLVMLLATVVVGLWVSGRIEDIVVRNTANATALYMESFVAPLTQDLAHQDGLSPDKMAELQRLLVDTPLGRRVVTFQDLGQGGEGCRLVRCRHHRQDLSADRKSEAGLARCRCRPISTHLGDLEDENEARLGVPLLEIYSPIRRP